MNDLALAKRSTFGERMSKFTKDYAIVVAILLLMIIFTLASPYFLTYNNIRNILAQTVPIAVVCIGQALIVTTGQFDLSLGQNVCLTSCVLAFLVKFAGFNPWIGVICAVLVGMMVGFSNGVLIAYAGIPCFIVTLGFQMIAKGLSKIITNASPIPGMPVEIQFIGRGFIGGNSLRYTGQRGDHAGTLHRVHVPRRNGPSSAGVCTPWAAVEEAAYFAGIDVKMYRMLAYTIRGPRCAAFPA